MNKKLNEEEWRHAAAVYEWISKASNGALRMATYLHDMTRIDHHAPAASSMPSDRATAFERRSIGAAAPDEPTLILMIETSPGRVSIAQTTAADDRDEPTWEDAAWQ